MKVTADQELSLKLKDFLINLIPQIEVKSWKIKKIVAHIMALAAKTIHQCILQDSELF